MINAHEKEYITRYQNVQEILVQKDIDALFVYANNANIGGGNCLYLTGYRNSNSGFFGVVVPACGKGAVLTQKGVNNSDINYLPKVTWIEDVRSVGIRNADIDRGYSIDTSLVIDYAGVLKGVLEDKKILRGRIAIAGSEQMSYSLYQSFLDALAGYEVVNGNGIVESVRKVKSDYEIACFKEACKSADAALDALMEAVAPGVSRRQVFAKAAFVASNNGADGLVPLVGAGRDPFVWGTFPGKHIFAENDIVAAEYSASVNGYFSQSCRSRILGEPNPSELHAYHVLNQAEQAMAAALKPGAICKDIWAIGDKIIREGGCKFTVGRPGHGLGLTIGENFNITPTDETVLEQGCCLALHPSVQSPLHPDKERPVKIMLGNSYLITENGAERLTNAKYWH